MRRKYWVSSQPFPEHRFTEAQKARITLKAIESLTYTCSNPKLLLQLNQTLNRVLSEFRQSLPTEEGIVIRPQIATRVKKKDKRTDTDTTGCGVSSLPLYKKRGRIRTDSKYRKRVGRRAEQLRNVGDLLLHHMHACTSITKLYM